MNMNIITSLFQYAFAAARLPGAEPDRYVESEGDANGVVRGSYAYLDPNYQWRHVQYVADKDGFHVDPAVLPQAAAVNHPQVYQDTGCLKEQ